LTLDVSGNGEGQYELRVSSFDPGFQQERHRVKERMSNNQTKVPVKVTPNAARNEVLGLQNGVWRIKIAAPPDKGKANKELIVYLSELLDLKKDDLGVIRGHASRDKVVAVEGLSQAEIEQRLTTKM
jgi:uncharacterized protein (TIGR00251 family)